MREILHRPLYCGEVVYNKTRRRDPDGTATFARRPESDWMRVHRPELCIISPDEWMATHTRLRSLKTHVTQVVKHTHTVRRRRDIESKCDWANAKRPTVSASRSTLKTQWASLGPLPVSPDRCGANLADDDRSAEMRRHAPHVRFADVLEKVT